jgi:hypothetical protein
LRGFVGAFPALPNVGERLVRAWPVSIAWKMQGGEAIRILPWNEIIWQKMPQNVGLLQSTDRFFLFSNKKKNQEIFLMNILV